MTFVPSGKWVIPGPDPDNPIELSLFIKRRDVEAVDTALLVQGPGHSVRLRDLRDLPLIGDDEPVEPRLPCGCPNMDDWEWLTPCPGHAWTHWHPHKLDALAEVRFCFYCGDMEHQRLVTDDEIPANRRPIPEDVGLLRYCPACARPAKESEYVNDDMVCTCCDRPWNACPCTPPWQGPCRA